MERREKVANPNITFVSIATGRYIDFWENQIYSAKEWLDRNEEIEFVILTDQPDVIKSYESRLFNETNWTLQIGIVPHQVWPFPTLLKFKHITSNAHLINGKVVWHLDADMLFASTWIHRELVEAVGNEIILVNHPGYFRSTGFKKIQMYLRNPDLLIKDFKSYAKEGGVGTWEKSRASRAFVEKRKRTEYVCGGSWGGAKDCFISFCTEMSSRVDEDLSAGVIARFHDESHINWFKANRECKVLSPSYCFEETYKHLKNLDKKIVAVNKNVISSWDR